MRSRKGRWNTGLLERHLRIVLAGLIGVERLRSGTTSGAVSAGLRIWTCFPLKKKRKKEFFFFWSEDVLQATSFLQVTSLLLTFVRFHIFIEQQLATLHYIGFNYRYCVTDQGQISAGEKMLHTVFRLWYQQRSAHLKCVLNIRIFFFWRCENDKAGCAPL